MIQAQTPDGLRGPRATGDRGTCPGCVGETIAKCGTQVVHHWAHRAGGECDAWTEPETAWHQILKTLFAEGDTTRIEVPIRSVGLFHIADALTREGWVVEIQRSSISRQRMREREQFYASHTPGMIWVFPVGTTDHRLLDARARFVLVDDTCTHVVHLGKRFPLAEVAPRIVAWLDEHPAPVVVPPPARPAARPVTSPAPSARPVAASVPATPSTAPQGPYKRDKTQGLSLAEREAVYAIRQSAADYARKEWGRDFGAVTPDFRPWNQDGLLDGLGAWKDESGLRGRYLTHYVYE